MADLLDNLRCIFHGSFSVVHFSPARKNSLAPRILLDRQKRPAAAFEASESLVLPLFQADHGGETRPSLYLLFINGDLDCHNYPLISWPRRIMAKAADSRWKKRPPVTTGFSSCHRARPILGARFRILEKSRYESLRKKPVRGDEALASVPPAGRPAR